MSLIRFNLRFLLLAMALSIVACTGSAKISQGNDAAAASYRPNSLSSTSAEISASTGGYINVGKAQLRIPSQALESDTTITAELVDIALPEGGAKAIGQGIRLKPEGLQFLKPAELMLCYSAGEVADLNAQGARIFYHTEDNHYVAIAGSADTHANCVSSHIEHFSSYVAAAYTQLPGNTAPVIGGANFLPTTPLAGVPLRVRTTIDDLNGSTPVGQTVPGTVVTAFLYYRSAGSATFTKVALLPDTTDDTVTNRYYFQIPGAEVTMAGIEYYLEATDNLNVTRRLPAAAGTFSTRTVPFAATGIRFSPTGTLNISAGFSRSFTLQASYLNASNVVTWQNISADAYALTNASLGSVLRSGPSSIRFNAVGSGSGALTSTVMSFSTSTSINVVPGLLTHIELTDTNQVALSGTLELPVSQTFGFDVIGHDSFGNVAQVYPTFTTTGGIGNVTVDMTGAHFNSSSSVASGSIIADLAGLTDTLSISLYPPPQVTATAPFDSTQGVALISSIGISFSHVMDTSTLTATTTGVCAGSLQVSSDNFATCVAMSSATPVFYGSNTLAVLQPASSLAGSTTYKIRVTTAARNTGGYPFAQIYTTTTGFTTVPAAAAGIVGEPDPDFGSTPVPGVIAFPGSLGKSSSASQGLIKDAADNIYFTGYQFDGNGDRHMIVSKYEAATQTASILFVEASFSLSEGYDIKLDSNEQLVISGHASNVASAMGDQAALWKMNKNGVPDAAFGTNGAFLMPLAGSRSRGLVLDTTNNIIVAGKHSDLIAFKVDSTGQLITSFGNGGVVTLPVLVSGSGDNEVIKPLISAFGDIFVLGYRYTPLGSDGAIWKVQANGQVQNTFGIAGSFTYGLSDASDQFVDMEIESSGRLIVLGISFLTNPSGSDSFLLAVDSINGVLDTTYGGGGVLHFDQNPGSLTWAIGLNLDQFGRAIITGAGTVNGANIGSCAWRVAPGGVFDSTFGSAGRVCITPLLGFLGKTVLDSQGRVVSVTEILAGNYGFVEDTPAIVRIR